MPNTIQIKRKLTTGAPLGTSLATGEMCLVIPDKQVYIKNEDGTVTLINQIDKETTIDFGVNPKHQVTKNIIDINCTATSVIEVLQVFKSQTEANFGVTLQLFTECFTGNFNIIAISTEPFSNGIFNLKYKIQ